MRLGTVPSGHVSVSEAILHLQVMPGKLLCGVNLGQAGTDSGLGQSCRRLQCPFVPTLSPAAQACLLATRSPCPSRAQPHLGPAEVPPSRQAMVLLALRGVLVGFLIGRRERPKALMASLLWCSTFHRREDSAKVPSGIRQVWRTGAP